MANVTLLNSSRNADVIIEKNPNLQIEIDEDREYHFMRFNLYEAFTGYDPEENEIALADLRFNVGEDGSFIVCVPKGLTEYKLSEVK